MTASENFVARWARLKRNADPRRRAKGITDTQLSTRDVSISGAEAANSQPQNVAATTDELFDPAGLPSIEAITANTDIRGFLQSRVPAELTRAALRQTWASDPAIRDFIGIAENQWDFNDPNAIPGFGPSQEQACVPALLAQALGRPDWLAETIADMPLAAAEQLLPIPAYPEPADLGTSAQPTFDGSPATNTRGLREESSGEGAAVDDGTAGHESRPNRRSHGSALPR
jgi:Protein of unknown function (DUF3306)